MALPIQLVLSIVIVSGQWVPGGVAQDGNIVTCDSGKSFQMALICS